MTRRIALAPTLALVAACGPTVMPADGNEPDATETGTRDALAPDVAPIDATVLDALAADVPATDAPVDVAPATGSAIDPCTHPTTCGAVTFTDPQLSNRQACHFAAGADVSDSIGALGDLRAAIHNVVVIMEENRSFDHMYGTLGRGTGFPAGYSNRKADGTVVTPHHLTTPCAPRTRLTTSITSATSGTTA